MELQGEVDSPISATHMQLFNLTPFASERVITSSRTGRDTLLLVVKASFSLGELVGDTPARAPQQTPVILVDEYLAEAGQSSLVRTTDLVPEKPNAEVVVVGHVTPRRETDDTMELGLRIGAIDKQVRLHGDRVWVRTVTGVRPSAPVALRRTPLVWERAFGGVDETTHERFDANPIGCGFRGKKSRADLSGRPVPNFVYPAEPVQSPSEVGRPAGFGFLAPAWYERRRHAGTFDDAWEKKVSPFLPADFDARFYLGAPRDQQLRGPIVGGERMQLTGFLPAGTVNLVLPRIQLDLSAMMGSELAALPAVCDTLIVDLDAGVLNLVWRGRLDVHERLEEIRWIRAALAEPVLA